MSNKLHFLFYNCTRSNTLEKYLSAGKFTPTRNSDGWRKSEIQRRKWCGVISARGTGNLVSNGYLNEPVCNCPSIATQTYLVLNPCAFTEQFCVLYLIRKTALDCCVRK